MSFEEIQEHVSVLSVTDYKVVKHLTRSTAISTEDMDKANTRQGFK